MIPNGAITDDAISSLFPTLFSFSALLPLNSLFPPFPPLLLFLSAAQGAEAEGEPAAQRAQVPDPRLHRISEAEVGVLWVHVEPPRDGPARGGPGQLEDCRDGPMPP